MPLPTETELIDGFLAAMHEIGRPASIEEQDNEIIRLLNIDRSSASESHDGKKTKLRYRLAWIRTYLKTIGIVQSVERGIWTLTDKGTKIKSLNQIRALGLDTPESVQDDNGIEGLDEDFEGRFGEYPIDSVLIRQETRTVFETIRRIKDDRFIMNPDFQRDFIWRTDKQSKLIESMLMRIPLPVFYLAEREDGKTVVVDGLQRLTTILHFLNNEFSLRALRQAESLNGFKFNQLPPMLQNRIEDTQLILYLIDSKLPEQAKLDIFERVNGGIPLTRQQMRNSLYCGKATRWLRDEAKTDIFVKATGGSLDTLTMRDRECINRFCAFSILGLDAYTREDMDEFLARALVKMNYMSDDDLNRIRSDFRRGMANNYTVFGRHSFRKHRNILDRRSVINVALFDVFSVILSRFSEEQAKQCAEKIHNKFLSLMGNADFIDSISMGTNSKVKVNIRFMLTEAALKEYYVD